MGNDWWSYLDKLETIAFFSGYPLVFAAVKFISKNFIKDQNSCLGKAEILLPYAYALVGTLYLGLVLKNLYPCYSQKNIFDYFNHSYLKIWGLLSIIFWIPLVAQKTIISLLHSFVFFFFLVKDIVQFSFSVSTSDLIKNDMKVYSDSLLLNIASISLILILCFLIKKVRNKRVVG